MGDHLDFGPQVVLAKASYPNTRPDGPVVWHVSFKVAAVSG